ncbi:MAG: hypothetical protein RBT49_17960 [Bacteroidales bacterium]|jgi:hypothetical protein|nr:hypothetical protein [Bacteroidales bacterium]
MKKFLLTVIILLNIHLIFAQIVVENNDSLSFVIYDFPEVNSKGIRTIDSVSTIDSKITRMLDDILKKEKMCTYFSNTLCLSMRISKIIDDTEVENKQSYTIKFELCEINTAVSLAPNAFFVYQNIIVFIFDNVLLKNNLYVKSGHKKIFNYNTDIKLIFDDFSQYFLNYIDGRFFYVEINKCD